MYSSVMYVRVCQINVTYLSIIRRKNRVGKCWLGSSLKYFWKHPKIFVGSTLSTLYIRYLAHRQSTYHRGDVTAVLHQENASYEGPNLEP